MTIINELSELAPFIEQELAPIISPHSIISINGELGAGKTTLIRTYLETLGIMNEVTSPTYTLEHIYKPQNILPIRHIDLYRLSSYDDILEELESDNNYHATFIEWAKKFPQIDKLSNIQIELSIIDIDKREITISC